MKKNHTKILSAYPYCADNSRCEKKEKKQRGMKRKWNKCLRGLKEGKKKTDYLGPDKAV